MCALQPKFGAAAALRADAAGASVQPVFHVPSDAVHHRRDANDPDCEQLLAARRPHFSDTTEKQTNFPPTTHAGFF